MTEPQGYTIGFKEIYEKLEALADRFASHITRQDLAVQALDHRVSELEKAKADAAALKRLFWLAVISSLLLPVVASVVTALIIK